MRQRSCRGPTNAIKIRHQINLRNAICCTETVVLSYHVVLRITNIIVAIKMQQCLLILSREHRRLSLG